MVTRRLFLKLQFSGQQLKSVFSLFSLQVSFFSSYSPLFQFFALIRADENMDLKVREGIEVFLDFISVFTIRTISNTMAKNC